MQKYVKLFTFAAVFEIPHTGLRIEDGECIALVGPAGSGKSRLEDSLAGFYPGSVKYIAFQDSYGFSSDQNYYLQQRYNSTALDEDSPTGRQVLERAALLCGSDSLGRLVEMFGLDGILDKDPVTYSSGELRKFQIVKALLKTPKMLVIDSPFIGLDPSARKLLSGFLGALARELTIVMALSRPEEIPSFITHVIELPQMRKLPLREYLDSVFAPEVISFRHVTVRYGSRVILRDLDWTVRRGEHWVLTGPNGSGKSTLLSLVCADNPMAYACDISLFGRRRGTGESIWEIKKRIGYISPELHRAYRRDQKALEVVAGGLFDTMGLIHNVSDAQREQCLRWMTRFGIEADADVMFSKLSSTRQRLCLVCRAFVKEPELLILDEPLHGLDNPARFFVRGLIDEYCAADPARTLIMVSHYPEEYPSCIDHSLTL